MFLKLTTKKNISMNFFVKMKISLDRISKFLKIEEKDLSQISHDYKNGLKLKFSLYQVYIFFF